MKKVIFGLLLITMISMIIGCGGPCEGGSNCADYQNQTACESQEYCAGEGCTSEYVNGILTCEPSYNCIVENCDWTGD